MDAFNSISLQQKQAPRDIRISTNANTNTSSITNNHNHHTASTMSNASSNNYNNMNDMNDNYNIDEEDADSSQAIADEQDGCYYDSSTSSLEEDEVDDCDDDSSLQLLNDKEALQKDAERKVMLELVFGPDSSFVPPHQRKQQHPADRKLAELIQKSLQQQQKGAAVPQETQDDMSLTAAYNSSSTVTTSSSSNNNNDDVSLSSSARRMPADGLLKRSNSLPDNMKMDTVGEDVEMDDD